VTRLVPPPDAHAPEHRRSTVTYPNGILAMYGYDTANQLTSLAYTLNSTAIGSVTYAYDLAGNRVTVGGSWARTGLPQVVSNATYDAGNRLVTWGTQRFSYDLNGNLGSDGPTSYTWNARNQLTGMSGGTSTSFAYDGLGRRSSRTIIGASANFLSDDLNTVQELSGITPAANLLTGGLDETFTRTDGTGTRSLLVDGLGSTLELADSSGTLQTHYTFEPFGATTTLGATSTNPQAFTGRENDGTGLYFYRARYYNPTYGRFISEDPIGFRGGINVYAYVGGNPLSWVDALGLAKCPPNVRKFFKDLDVLLNGLANDLNTSVLFLEALSSLESGWYNTHNRSLNNPFGLTRAGGRNLSFPNVQAAIDYWNQDWGDAVRGAQTMDQFIQDLEGGKRKYNDVTKDYSDRLRKQYDTVKKYRDDCRCTR